MNYTAASVVRAMIIVSLSVVAARGSNNGYEPSAQRKTGMQYFKPVEDSYFAGDPMPFYHDGVLHVYWLVDCNHAEAEFGGHQWAHCSTKNLKEWSHHPMAVTITEDYEKSICTGSVVWHEGRYWAFYATRTDTDRDGVREEHISAAESDDGVLFRKLEPNKLLTAPAGFAQSDFRDPHVFWDDDSRQFHMLVTTAFTAYEYLQNQTCLVYYVSKDLRQWRFRGPFYVPGYAKGYPYPECADCFQWNGYWYLMFKTHGGTYYRISRSVKGPWIATVEDNIGSDYALVFKTAAFKDNRRIAVGMVPSRKDNLDDGAWQYGGNLAFRELLQNADGTLKAVFPPEMAPRCGGEVKITLVYADKPRVAETDGGLEIKSQEGFAAARYSDIPLNACISFEVEPETAYTVLGCFLRESASGSYDLAFTAKANKVQLGNNSIEGVPGLDKPFNVEIVMAESIIDVCVAGKRCILNRCPQQKGDKLTFYCQNGTAKFRNIKVRPILDYPSGPLRETPLADR